MVDEAMKGTCHGSHASMVELLVVACCTRVQVQCIHISGVGDHPWMNLAKEGAWAIEAGTLLPWGVEFPLQ
eukprot:6961284-Alexandrium_andersonii.AAC.1